MKNLIIKKLILNMVVLFVTLFVLSSSSAVFAAETNVTSYEQILSSANEKYGLNLGYVPVDENNISLEDYRIMTEQFAFEQRNLLNYIESRRTFIPSTRLDRMNGAVKTRTKDVWEIGKYFSITATYTLYNNQTISKCRNASINSKPLAGMTNTYLTNVSAPRYGLIDSGRTSTVQYTATIHFDKVSYNNSTIYTEFYYDD